VTERQRARRRITVGVLLVSALGWTIQVSTPLHGAVMDLCRGGSGRGAWLPLALWLQDPGPMALARSWWVMLMAMMAPTLIAPLLHVHQRSFRRRRARSLGLFVLGYCSVWMFAGAALTLLQGVLLGLANGAVWPALAMGALALCWQCSPLKQRCLNRSHNHRELAAFGLAADHDALGFGLSHGAWCFGSCWALMLLPLLWVQAHVVTMMAATLWMSAERLEGPRAPRWKFRGPGKLARILWMQLRKLRVERTAAGWPAESSRRG